MHLVDIESMAAGNHPIGKCLTTSTSTTTAEKHKRKTEIVEREAK